MFFFFFSSRRRHTRLTCDWSSDVCSSDLLPVGDPAGGFQGPRPIEGAIVCCRHGQDRIEPSPAFAQMRAHLPETPQRRAEAKRALRIFTRHRPVKGSPEVVLVKLEAV